MYNKSPLTADFVNLLVQSCNKKLLYFRVSKLRQIMRISNLVSEGEELHDALDGEEDGEHQVAVRQNVREFQRSTVILK